MQTLATRAGMGRSSLQRWLNDLVDLDWLTKRTAIQARRDGGRPSNQYTDAAAGRDANPALALPDLRSGQCARPSTWTTKSSVPGSLPKCR